MGKCLKLGICQQNHVCTKVPKKVLQKMGKVQASPYCSSYLLPRECKIRFQPTLPSFALESSISTVPIPQSLCFALFAISFFFHFLWFFYKIDRFKFFSRHGKLDRLDINCAHPLIGSCVYFLFKFPPCFVWHDNPSL